MANKYFFDHSGFLNTVYALNIAMENHLASVRLGNEIDRIVYSSTNFALRERSKNTTWSESYLPFMNYRIDDISEGSDRPVWNSMAKLHGMYLPGLSKYVRYTPITITYDCTLWYHQPLDNLYGLTETVWDDTSETIIDYYINIDDIDGNTHQIKLYGILGYNFQYNPTFDKSSWLEENRIATTTLNFEVQTLLLKEGAEAWLPDEVILEFAHSKGLDPEEYDETISIMHDYTGLR